MTHDFLLVVFENITNIRPPTSSFGIDPSSLTAGATDELLLPLVGILLRSSHLVFMAEVGRDELGIPSLPRAAREGRVLSNLKQPLVGVKKSCQNNPRVIFDGDNVEVADKRNGRAVLRGHCVPEEADLCLIPVSDEHQRLFPVIRTNPTERALNSYEVRAVPALTQHPHGCEAVGHSLLMKS